MTLSSRLFWFGKVWDRRKDRPLMGASLTHVRWCEHRAPLQNWFEWNGGGPGGAHCRSLGYARDDKGRVITHLNVCESDGHKNLCLLLLLFFPGAFQICQVGETERVPGGRIVGPGQEQQTGHERPQHQAHRDREGTVDRMQVHPGQGCDVEHLCQLPGEPYHDC